MKKHNIEQQTPEWHQLKKGKISGTVLKALMSSRTKKDAIYELVAQKLTIGVQEDYENAMDRGNRLEPEAIAAFEFETGKKVERTGFIESDDNEHIGSSPDGIIGDTEAVEVKCLNGTKHVKMWLEDEIPKEYEWQVVQYFVVNDKLEKLYFVGYNPDILLHPLNIITIERKELEEKIHKAKQVQLKALEQVEAILGNIIKL